MFRFGTGELFLIFLIVLVLFGASRLPQIARSLGEAIKELRRAGRAVKEEVEAVSEPDEE